MVRKLLLFLLHLWVGKPYGSADQGTRQAVAAPLGQRAVFCRAGSAVGEQFAANVRQAGLFANAAVP